ncbi:MAG: protein kinase [Pseudomonadota bacterium]|nr:protein kinase [Pseudomonadota bacterium]
MAPTDPAATLDEGAEEVRGRFPGLRVEGRIGSGGSGVVYRAWSEPRGAWVALKVLRAGRWASESQRLRFQREVDVHRRLDDPGVVRIFEAGTSDEGAPWLTMELVDGPSLQGLLDTGALPPLRERVGWIVHLAHALARLHARGVFHRDVKPSNVLLAEGREPRLADFGIVMTEAESRLTLGSRAVGTPRFMAPEQIVGEVTDWGRVDLYALGLILAELLGGRRDPRASATIDLAGVPADLRWIVTRAIAPVPASRYANTSAFAEDLERWLAGRPVRWRPEAVAWRLREQLRWRVSLFTVGAGVVIVLALAGVGSRWAEARREAATATEWAGARERLGALWTTGDTAGAEEWVRRFAEDPARHDTAAVGAAWLDLAALQRAANAPGAEITSIGRALAATTDAGVRERGIEALVDVYRRTRQWAALDRLLHAELLVPLDVDLRREASVDIALAAGDIAAALALLPPERAALLAPFQGVHGFPNTVWSGVDTDGDARLEWLENTGADVPERDGDRWRVQPETRGITRLSDGRTVATGGADLWQLTAAGVTRLGPGLAKVAEVGGRIFGTQSDRPRVVVELAGGALVPMAGPTGRLESYVTGLTSGDVDGDGVPELVSSHGPPHGFLVRVERADGDGMTTLAEARPGFVNGVLVLQGPAGPRILASISRENPSATLFGTTDVYGGPCRLLSLRVQAGTLVEEQALVWPSGTCPSKGLHAADLDGDGILEVLLDMEDNEMAVLRQTPDGRLERAFVLPALSVIQVLQSDGDPADELLLEERGIAARERRHWLVGDADATDGALPTRTWPAWTEEPGDGVSGLFQRLSLDAQAAELAEQRGEYARAARLWVRAGKAGRAASACAEEYRRTSDPTALEEAVALALQYPDPALAEDVAGAAAAIDPAHGRAVRVRLDAARTPDWKADLARTLDPALQLPLPSAVRHDLGNGELRITVPSGVGTVLRLPLRTTGAPPWIHVAADWLRAEWGSSLDVAVRPVGAPDARGVGLRLQGVGAGGVLFRSARLLLNPTPSLALLSGVETPDGPRARVAGTDVVTTFDLRIGGTGDPATAAVLGTSDGMAISTTGAAGPLPTVGEAWELVVAGGRGWDAQPGQLAILQLRRLEIGGFALADEPTPDLAPSVAWAMHGGARPAVVPEDDALLIGLARLDPSLFDRVAAAWGPSAAAGLFAAAWNASAFAHRSDPLTVTALLSAPPPNPEDPRSLPSRVARGEALMRVGHVGEARSELLACWEAARPEPSEWRWALDAAALLAELTLAGGDEGGAREWVERAVSVAPDADLGRRLLRHRPRLSGLVGRPGWAILGG